MPGPHGYEHDWEYVGGPGLPSKAVMDAAPHTKGAAERVRVEHPNVAAGPAAAQRVMPITDTSPGAKARAGKHAAAHGLQRGSLKTLGITPGDRMELQNHHTGDQIVTGTVVGERGWNLLHGDDGHRYDIGGTATKVYGRKIEPSIADPDPSGEVLLTDRRSVRVLGIDGNKVTVYDPSSLRREVVSRDRIVAGGPTKAAPATVKLSDPQRMVAIYRFEDVMDGTARDDELGAKLTDRGLVVHNAAAAVATLDAAVEILRDSSGGARTRAEMAATKKLREKILGLVL